MLKSTQISTSKFFSLKTTPMGPCWKNAILNCLQFIFSWCWRVYSMSDTILYFQLVLEPFMASWLQNWQLLDISNSPRRVSPAKPGQNAELAFILRARSQLVNNPRGHTFLTNEIRSLMFSQKSCYSVTQLTKKNIQLTARSWNPTIPLALEF